MLCSVNVNSLFNYSRENNCVRSMKSLLCCVYFTRDLSSNPLSLMNTCWCSVNDNSLFNYSRWNNYVRFMKSLLCCVYFMRDLSSNPCGH
jgi:hypothetical protein